MKKLLPLLLFALFITGCDLSIDNNSSKPTDLTSQTSNLNSGITSTTNLEVNLDTLKSEYGAFSVVTEKGSEGKLSSDGKVFTISFSTYKSSYIFSGYFDGKIIINNANNLTSYKGVKIALSHACFVNTSGSNIEYQVSGKNIEVVAKRDTENYIINTGEGYDDAAVTSENNIEIDGNGILNIITSTGHALRAEDTIRFYDSPVINISSGHDAIHAEKFISNNEETVETDFVSFSGTLNIVSAISQGFDCTTSLGTGTIEITSGNYNITHCESAFKTDVSLNISNAQVKASNLTSDPVVRGDNSTGVTIQISSNAIFLVDNIQYTKTNI